MNKKGFTLIELIAIIIIIGVIASIAIVSVQNSVTKSKDESFVDLAKNYVESARVMRASDKLYYEPKNKEAILIPYSEINGTEISNKDITGYGNIIPSNCFIGILNKNGTYYFYINQADNSNHVLDRKDANTVTKLDIQAIDNINSLVSIKTPLSSFSINYGGDDYSVKAVGVEFDSKYVRNGNTKFISSFDIKEQNKNFKGLLSLYSWTGTSSAKKIELKVINNQIGELSNITYTFKKTTSGAIGKWYAVDSEGEQLSINGYPFILDVKRIENDYVDFQIDVGNKIPYDLIRTSISAPLYGYYTKDSSYISSSAQIKGNISAYDSFASSGKFQSTNSKNITIDGINYEVNGSKVLYVVVKQ